MDYKKYLLNKNIKVKEALKKFNGLRPKIVFVVEYGKLLGSLTDGDIRRYLLAGGKVDDTVYKACNKKPKKIAYSLAEAKGMLDENFIGIPIIDKNKKVIDVYIGNSRKTINKKKLNVPIVINAGGKGTRLEPFTKVLPKPLIPVGDLPIIEHIMNRYEEFGCDKFNIIVNYKKELIKSYFKEIDKQYKINWFDENTPLGTGGGLSLLKNKIKETFFFITCDNLILVDYNDILDFHKKNQNDITMVCAKKNMTIPYGIVQTDDNNVLDTIVEKPEYSFLTNTAMYVIEPSVLKDIKKEKIDFPEFIKQEKQKGKKIGVYSIDEKDWLDMGIMSELEKMRVRLYGE